MREAMDVSVRVREREKENEVRKQPRVGGPRGAFLTKQNGLFILSKKKTVILKIIYLYINLRKSSLPYFSTVV